MPTRNSCHRQALLGKDPIVTYRFPLTFLPRLLVGLAWATVLLARQLTRAWSACTDYPARARTERRSVVMTYNQMSHTGADLADAHSCAGFAREQPQSIGRSRKADRHPAGRRSGEGCVWSERISQIEIDGEEVSDLYQNLISLEVELDDELAGMFTAAARDRAAAGRDLGLPGRRALHGRGNRSPITAGL